MDRLNRGDKLYLDNEKTIESEVNKYLDCRDGIIEVYEYVDSSGYGSDVRLFLCQNVKHESVSIIRQTKTSSALWTEEEMAFDEDSFEFLKALIIGKKDQFAGEYFVVRDFSKKRTN